MRAIKKGCDEIRFGNGLCSFSFTISNFILSEICTNQNWTFWRCCAWMRGSWRHYGLLLLNWKALQTVTTYVCWLHHYTISITCLLHPHSFYINEARGTSGERSQKWSLVTGVLGFPIWAMTIHSGSLKPYFRSQHGVQMQKSVDFFTRNQIISPSSSIIMSTSD